MPRYFIAYVGGNPPSTPAEGKEHMARYMTWLSSLGEAAVSPANPLRNTSTIKPDGSVEDGGTTAMSGFTILELDSMDAALLAARTCPFLEVGGSLEVSELIEMKPPG